MTKFVQTVSAQRAIKIEKQLKDQGMDSQNGKRAKRAIIDHSQQEKLQKDTEAFEAQLAKTDENTCDHETDDVTVRSSVTDQVCFGLYIFVCEDFVVIFQ